MKNAMLSDFENHYQLQKAQCNLKARRLEFLSGRGNILNLT